MRRHMGWLCHDLSRASRVLVLAVTALCAYSGAVDAAPNRRALTMRFADRAIDLAWQAELAGDYAGAKNALDELVKTATLSAESPARSRLAEWLDALGTRQHAFETNGKNARAYFAAFGTMKEFGIERASELWARARGEVPALRAVITGTTSVRLRVESIRGAVDRASVEKALAELLRRHGLAAAVKVEGKPSFEVRLDVDASDVEVAARSARVTSAVTGVLRALDSAGKQHLAGNVSKRRSERRRTEQEARAFVVKRTVEEVAQSIVYLIRLHILEELAAREGVKG